MERLIKELLNEAFEAGLTLADAIELNLKEVYFNDWYKSNLEKIKNLPNESKKVCTSCSCFKDIVLPTEEDCKKCGR